MLEAFYKPLLAKAIGENTCNGVTAARTDAFILNPAVGDCCSFQLKAFASFHLWTAYCHCLEVLQRREFTKNGLRWLIGLFACGACVVLATSSIRELWNTAITMTNLWWMHFPSCRLILSAKICRLQQTICANFAWHTVTTFVNKANSIISLIYIKTCKFALKITTFLKFWNKT